MRKTIITWLRKALLWGQRRSEVARFDHLILSDFERGKNKSTQYCPILLEALQLLKETDSRRLARVHRQLDYVVRSTLAREGSAEYHHDLRTCYIDFIEPSTEYDREYLVGWYACTLVHESTHGVIRSRNILYTPELRSRIEQLCVREEQRFVRRLHASQPGLAQRLRDEFDAARWEWHWSKTPGELLRAEIQRSFFPRK